MASKPIHQNDSPHLLFSSLTRPSPNPSESASQSTGSVSRIPHGLLIVLYQSNFHQFSLRAPQPVPRSGVLANQLPTVHLPLITADDHLGEVKCSADPTSKVKALEWREEASRRKSLDLCYLPKVARTIFVSYICASPEFNVGPRPTETLPEYWRSIG